MKGGDLATHAVLPLPLYLVQRLIGAVHDALEGIAVDPSVSA
jgi:hypothetical protein